MRCKEIVSYPARLLRTSQDITMLPIPPARQGGASAMSVGKEYCQQMSDTSLMKNNVKNVSFSVILQAVTVLTSFIVRVVFVHILGKEFNGLNSLFTEIIAMLSLMELGIGTSVSFSLYSPLASGNERQLCRIMTLFKNAYRLIALAIFIVGVAIIPFIGHIVEQVSFDISYIRSIFFLFVVRTSSSYLFSYNTALLTADQKNYIISVITGIVNIVISVLSIIGLVISHNYIVFLIIQIFGTLLTNVCILIKANKIYPFLRERDELTKDEKRNIFRNIKNIFIGNVSGKITNSTDNILISKLVNTAECGSYANYSVITNSVRSVFTNICNSVTGSIGNIAVTRSSEEIHSFHKQLTFIFFAFAMVSSIGFYGAADSFVELFFGSEYLMPRSVVLICSLNFFLLILREPLWRLMAVSGLFEQDKNISIVGTTVNLIVSVAAGIKYGMFGIFLGTTMTLVIQITLKLCLLYKRRLCIGCSDILLYWLKMVILYSLGLIICHIATCFQITENTLLSFILYGAISVAIAMLLILCAFGRSAELKGSLAMLHKIRSESRIFRK